MISRFASFAFFPLVCGDNSAFSFDEATRFARLAQVAYCDDSDDIRNWNCKACLETKISVEGPVRTIDPAWANATQAMIGRMSDTQGCFISFRGSHNIQNWIRDLEVWVDPTPFDAPDCDGCAVHTGFDTVWQNMEADVIGALSDAGCSPSSNKKLTITGHSLGAVLTTLASLTLQKKGFEIEKLYMFESPRIGNPEYANYWNSKLGGIPNWRITHHRDPVVVLPFLGKYYHHVSNEVYFEDASGQGYKVCSGDEDPSCADQYGAFVDLFYASEHCGAPAFGPDFDYCNTGKPPCFAPQAADARTIVV